MDEHKKTKSVQITDNVKFKAVEVIDGMDVSLEPVDAIGEGQPISPKPKSNHPEEISPTTNHNRIYNLVLRPKINFLLWRSMYSIEADLLTSSRYSLLGDIVSSILFSRVAYVLIAEQNILSFDGLAHLIVIHKLIQAIITPYFITIHQMVYSHDVLFAKYDFIHFLYVYFRIGLMFYLSWSVPSAFSSSVANLPSFIFGLIFARLSYCGSNLVTSFFDSDARLQLTINVASLIFPAGICYIM
jgi:hypothetical protein